MSGVLERRWDDAVESAWREFRQGLADRLSGLAEDETLIVELTNDEEGGAAPYCQAVAGAGWLRVEAVSNHYLAVNYLLSDPEHDLLRSIGFSAPSYDELKNTANESSNFWIDLEQREADRAAVMMVRALREVYAVLHPCYLEPEVADESLDEGPPRLIPPKPRPQDPVTPQDPDELRRAIDLAVRGLLDDRPEWDEDGDLVLPTSCGLVWVSVATNAARILIHAPLVDEVVDESRALVEVNLLNQREFGLTFALKDNRIRVTRDLDVTVLIPASCGSRSSVSSRRWTNGPRTSRRASVASAWATTPRGSRQALVPTSQREVASRRRTP